MGADDLINGFTVRKLWKDGDSCLGCCDFFDNEPSGYEMRIARL